MIEPTISIHEFVVDGHDEVEGVGPDEEHGQTSGQEVLRGQRCRVQQVGGPASQKASNRQTSLKQQKLWF